MMTDMNKPERSKSLFRFAAPQMFYPLAGSLAPWFAAAAVIFAGDRKSVV